jgi:hypothetical protein
MSIQRGSICEVIGSNFKDYVIALSEASDDHDDLFAMDDAGNVQNYDKRSLKIIKNVNIDEYMNSIRRTLLNDFYYQNNQGKTNIKSD